MERAQDIKLLNSVLRKEEIERQAEENKRIEAKRSKQLYQKYLTEMMEREREDQSQLDKILRSEQDKMWAAREAVLQAREDARAVLLRQVQEGREEQIAFKRREAQRVKAHDDQFVQQYLAEASRGVALEKDDIIRRREGAQKTNVLLYEQIAARRQQLEREKQEEVSLFLPTEIHVSKFKILRTFGSLVLIASMKVMTPPKFFYLYLILFAIIVNLLYSFLYQVFIGEKSESYGKIAFGKNYK